MFYLDLFGLLFNMLGVIFLTFGFQIEKAEDKSGFTINGNWAIVFKKENPLLRYLGWFCLVFGFVLQIVSLFVR